MRGANREDALIVAVMRDSKVFLGPGQVHPAELSGKIRQSVKAGAENKVYIRADARARYGAVKEVLEAVKTSGVENVAFLTEERTPTTQ